MTAADAATPDADQAHRYSARAVGRMLLATGGARLAVLPVTAAANLVTARLITDAVGVELFGSIMLIATLSQTLTFADLGVGAPVATATTQLDAQPSHVEQFRRTLLTATRTMLVSATVLVLGAVAIGVAGAWAPLLGIPDDFAGLSADATAVLALLAFAASLPFSLGLAVLRGGGRTHEAVLLSGLSALVALALSWAFRTLDAPPLAYALVIPLGTLAGTAVCGFRGWYLFRAATRGLVRQLGRPGRYAGSAISATARPWFIIMIGLPVALQSDRLVIAHRCAPVVLSDYSYVAQIYMPVWSVVSLAALALWPVFAAGSDSQHVKRRSWLIGLALLGSAGLALAAGLLVLGRLVVGWMSGGTADPDTTLFLAFAALLVVQSAHVTSGIMLISPEHLRFQAKCVVALVVTNLPLSWVLAPPLGAAGPVLASVVTVAVCQLVPGLVVAHRATRDTGRGVLGDA